ncbi:hypothetical protein BDEG_23807 [Batrachochytrium dendrobatidis JEL423]|uniref:Uncharacterized protein n=1 Tax=Batrachochytrium dendrobatidis (strain JEL423) TaxID=403673 RepID=A0A177WIS9_BATDL|nr:hypothetical protein BDEG_23807 [Batrachochytrium dendrobatidis JEL423]
MSAEVSTPTASTSGGSAGGPEYPEFPTPEDLEKYCSPFGISEVSLIDKIARNQVKINGIFEKSSSKSHERDLQKGLVDEMKIRLDTHSQASNDESGINEAELQEQDRILNELEKEVKKLSDEVMVLIEQNIDYKKTLRKYLGLVPSGEGEVPELEDYPGYTECYKYFLSVFSQ